MAAEREAAAVRRRVANEIAAAYRAVSSRPVPEPYTEALSKLGVRKTFSVSYDSAGIPLPYTTALKRRERP